VSDEAATIAGAGPLPYFRRIVQPTNRSAIPTLRVLIVLWIWNEFSFALILLQGVDSEAVAEVHPGQCLIVTSSST
jgi:ABC-type glycerol-3-phosphate transport system permease component